MLSLLTAECGGGGSGPAGPDEVPPAERQAHLDEMKQRLADPPHLVRMTITEIAALPQFPRAYTRPQLAEISALEERGVVVEGFVARLRQMTDGDYHIQLTEAWPGQCLDRDTSEQFFTELTPGIRARKPAYTWERLVPLCGAGTRIRVSGWLMLDTPHHTRITFWEVHPVTRIEVCCWRDLSIALDGQDGLERSQPSEALMPQPPHHGRPELLE
jgi:hypothetical protein